MTSEKSPDSNASPRMIASREGPYEGKYRGEVELTAELAVASVERPTTFSEIIGKVADHHRLIRAVAESHPSDGGVSTVYVLWVETSWHGPSLRLLNTHSAPEPRIFRDLDRLASMVREKFAFPGTIELVMPKSSSRPDIGLNQI